MLNNRGRPLLLAGKQELSLDCLRAAQCRGWPRIESRRNGLNPDPLGRVSGQPDHAGHQPPTALLGAAGPAAATPACWPLAALGVKHTLPLVTFCVADSREPWDLGSLASAVSATTGWAGWRLGGTPAWPLRVAVTAASRALNISRSWAGVTEIQAALCFTCYSTHGSSYHQPEFLRC